MKTNSPRLRERRLVRMSRWMRARRWARALCPPALFFVIALALGLRYRSIGSYVREDGVLVEPFYLIPLAYISGGIGGALLLIGVIRIALGYIRR